MPYCLPVAELCAVSRAAASSVVDVIRVHKPCVRVMLRGSVTLGQGHRGASRRTAS
jgi:hypothetical protein